MGSFPIYHRDDYWKIWFDVYRNGEKVGGGVWHQSYKHKSSAVRQARKHFDNRVDYSHLTGETRTYTWTVSQTNPHAK